MKTIIKILALVLICSNAFSQTKPLPPYTQLSTGNFRLGYIVNDSGLVFARRDTTAFRPTFPGTGLYRVVSGDSALWIFTGIRYDRVVMQKALNDTSTAIRNNLYWQINPTTLNLQNKPIDGPNVDLINNLKVNQTGLSTSQFTSWPTAFNSTFNHNVTGIYGREVSLDLLIDSLSQFQIGGLTFRTQKFLAPKLPASRFGASTGAKIEYNAFINGLAWTSTMEFYLGDRDNNTIHVFALSGPGTHFYGDRKVFTVESKEALMFGTAIRGVNSPAISGLDTTYFTGDAGNKPMYIFNMAASVMDTNTYKPIVYNTLTGEWGRSTWPQTGGGSSALNNTNLAAGYRLLIPVTQGIKTLYAGTDITIDSTTNPNGITINATGGGGGGTNNTNIGAGHRWLQPITQELRTTYSDITGAWDSASNSGGLTYKVDTVIMSTRAWNKKGNDSLGTVIALRVLISDTATMLIPYLRKTDTAFMLSSYQRKWLASGQIFVGNGLGVAAGVAPSGDISSISTAGAFTIANNTVTYAKIQQVAASRLLGNPTGSTANVSEIALGFGQRFNSNLLKSDTARKSGLPTYYYVDSAVTAGGGGTTDTTQVKPPIFVISGTKDTITLRYGYGLTLRASDSALIGDTSQLATQYDLTQISASPGGSNTQVQFNNSGAFGGDADFTYNSTTNVLTTGDFKFGTISNFSSLRRASVLYGGIEGAARTRDSTKESRFIIRLPFDGAGVITPNILADTDHEPIGYDSVKAVTSDILIYRPTVADVHSMWVQQDETLARLVGGFGPSVGLTAATIRGYMHSTWGGSIYWNSSTRVWYSDGANVNGNTPSAITYDSATGILQMTITTWMTTGSERDYKKLSATMSQEGIKVTFMVQNSSNTLLQFKITDPNGSILPPYMFDNTTAFSFIMPTWHSQIPLGNIGGSFAWLQNFITSSANLWGGETDKSQ